MAMANPKPNKARLPVTWCFLITASLPLVAQHPGPRRNRLVIRPARLRASRTVPTIRTWPGLFLDPIGIRILGNHVVCHITAACVVDILKRQRALRYVGSNGGEIRARHW